MARMKRKPAKNRALPKRSTRELKPVRSIKRLTVGLLGGSFNPAHDGHLHISTQALKRLQLDQVWWLVSPQNPLKPVAGMASLEKRMQSARLAARDRRIMVTDLEARYGTRHTALTLARLTVQFPHIRFVWLMGADNLLQIHNWHRWRDIFATVPLAVLARPTYDSRALAGRAALRFAKQRVSDRYAPCLAYKKPPAWMFLAIRRHPASATAIRRSGVFPV